MLIIQWLLRTNIIEEINQIIVVVNYLLPIIYVLPTYFIKLKFLIIFDGIHNRN